VPAVVTVRLPHAFSAAGPLSLASVMTNDGMPTRARSQPMPNLFAVVVGERWSLEGTNVLQLVRENCEAARIDEYSQLEGEIVEAVRRAGIRSTVGIPIVVAGRRPGVANARVPLSGPGRARHHGGHAAP
jgi:hypothetical protein